MDNFYANNALENIAIKSQTLSANNLYLSERLDAADRKATLLIPAAGLMMGLMHSELFVRELNTNPKLFPFQLTSAFFLCLTILFAVAVQWPRRIKGKDILSQLFGGANPAKLADDVLIMDTSKIIEDILSSQEILIKIFNRKNTLLCVASITFAVGCILNLLLYLSLTSLKETFENVTKALESLLT